MTRPEIHSDDPPAVDTVEVPSTRLPSGSVLRHLFHQVNSAIPEAQELVTVEPSTTDAEALALLERNRFSQAPVIRGVEVLGSFSYRSFTRGAIELQGGRYRLETLSRELGVEAHRLAATPSRPLRT